MKPFTNSAATFYSIRLKFPFSADHSLLAAAGMKTECIGIRSVLVLMPHLPILLSD